jgi:hypothetical protein
MKWHLEHSVVAAALLTLGLVVSGSSRNREEQDFPDYNRLEYAKPLPPPDQQPVESPRGSIQMRVGDKPVTAQAVPLDSLQVPIRPANSGNGSEPPLDFIDDPLPPATTVATSTFTAISSTPTVTK